MFSHLLVLTHKDQSCLPVLMFLPFKTGPWLVTHLYRHGQHPGPRRLRLGDRHAPHGGGGLRRGTGQPPGDIPDLHTEGV